MEELPRMLQHKLQASYSQYLRDQRASVDPSADLARLAALQEEH